MQKDFLMKNEYGCMSTTKLHGRTKIILRDVRTGEEEVLEKDNLVTDAVANIFANNLFGSANYSKLTPVKDMFGGVLCFESSQNSNALAPLNDHDNKLIAHAGQTAHSSASTTRGNPNGALSGVIQNGKGYKFVWDFATNQGNGTISSLSLCHKWGGDLGTKPIAAETGEYPFVVSTNKTKIIKAGLDADFVFSDYLHGLLECDIANQTGLHVSLSGTTLTVNEVALCLKTQGINDELGAAEITDTHTVTLTRTFLRRYSAICSDDDYIYVISAGSTAEATTLGIDKVSKSTWTATASDITDASLSLGNADNVYIQFAYDAPMINKVIVSGGYLYWPNSDGTSFYKFNLSNSADITLLDSTLQSAADLTRVGMCEISDGLIIGNGFIINHNNVYPTDVALTFDNISTAKTTPYELIRLIKSGDIYYLWGWGTPDYVSMTVYLGVVFPTLYCATIQNLNSSVTKTSDKTMQIEYSITLEEET